MHTASARMRFVVASTATFLLLWVGTVLAETNTTTDASFGDFVSCNGRAGFRTSELLQNQTDLNSDLDFADNVLQVINLGLGTIINVGLDASGPLACGGHLFAFGVSEFNQGGVDLNGDLDAFDIVLHVYNASTTTLTNTGLAVSWVETSSDLVAFGVPEALQGVAGTDLNTDLDTADVVLHVFDPVALTSTNIGQEASSTVIVAGSRVAFLTSEAGQGGVSLNSDVDTLDSVLQVYDYLALTMTNVGRQAETNLQFNGDAVAFLVSESAEASTSFNPDPDASDLVVQTYCVPLAPCATLGLDNLAYAADSLALEGDILAFGVRERRQHSVDLNGDGDRGDSVLHVHRLSTGATTNTANAAYRGVSKVAGNFVIFKTPERNQNKTDLNGDGDKRDLVAQIYDVLAGVTTNTSRAVGRNCTNSSTPDSDACYAIRGDNLMLLVRERDQDRTDLNGDTDIRDRVVELWRVSASALSSSGRAATRRGGLAMGNSIVAFRRYEREEHADLNGDGDKSDFVSAVFDSATLMTTTLSSAEDLFLVEGDTVVIRTREGVESVDLNLDADFDDGILQYQAF